MSVESFTWTSFEAWCGELYVTPYQVTANAYGLAYLGISAGPWMMGLDCPMEIEL